MAKKAASKQEIITVDAKSQLPVIADQVVADNVGKLLAPPVKKKGMLTEDTPGEKLSYEDPSTHFSAEDGRGLRKYSTGRHVS